jgi:acyl-CoA reductase-like NAD-dependent aldehyde dehydrogenase
MGNAVIVKPASLNPSAAVLLVELLLQSGVPCGAIQVLTGRGESLGTLLSESERKRAISFTGSTRAGIDIACHAAVNMTRVFLECGENDPLIVLPDADLDLTIEELVFSRALNAGQTCCSTKRILVHNSMRAP